MLVILSMDIGIYADTGHTIPIPNPGVLHLDTSTEELKRLYMQ